MSELRRGVDELEGDLLEVSARGVNTEGLAEGDDTLLDTGDGALEHDKVVADKGVVRPAADGVDRLLGEVELGGAGALVGAVVDAVDLVVDRGTAVVTVLTGTGNREHDLRRVPSTDTGDLAETTVGLAGKLGNTPTRDDTGVTVTLGDGDNVDALVLLEDGLDVKGLLEVGLGELDLVGDGATVDLDLGEVGLLLGKAGLRELGVGEDANDGGVLLDTLKLASNGGAVVLGVLLGVAGEGLLLRTVPVLVEATLDLVREVLGPNGGKGAETTGSLNVADDTDDDHGGSLDDGDGLDDLTLVHLRAGAVEVTDDVGHTGLVTKHGGQVDRLLGVILGEGLDVTTVLGGTLAGKEGKRTGTRLLVLFNVSDATLSNADPMLPATANPPPCLVPSKSSIAPQSSNFSAASDGDGGS